MRAISKTAFVAGGALALVILVLTASCGNGNGTEGDAPLILRSYDIAPELAPELRTILNDVLAGGEEGPPVGRAEVGPSGQLIVAAPGEVHEGVEELIAQLRKAAPGPPPMITITYWIVAGGPAQETTWPPRVEELAPALDGIASAEGPTRFRLLERAQLRSLSGERGRAQSHLFHIQQRATTSDGQILADLELTQRSIASGGIDTRVSLGPDQVLVLGQSALPDKVGVGAKDAESLYVVVRAQVEATTSR